MKILYADEPSIHVAINPNTARIIAMGNVRGTRIIRNAIVIRGLVATAHEPRFDSEWLFVDPFDLMLTAGWLRQQHPTWGEPAIRRHLLRMVRPGSHGGDMLRLVDAAVADEWPNTVGETEWLAGRIAESCADGWRARAEMVGALGA